MKSPSDIDQMNYYHDRWIKERDSEIGSDCNKKEYQLGYIAYEISKMISEYNKVADEIAYTRRFWWWQYAVTKRTLNKFKIKFIYRSEKAREYFKKLLWKESKVKGKRLDDVHKKDVIAFINAMANDDRTHGSQEHYVYILRRLEND